MPGGPTSYIAALVSCLRPCVCVGGMVVDGEWRWNKFKAAVDHPTPVWVPHPCFSHGRQRLLGGSTSPTYLGTYLGTYTYLQYTRMPNMAF